MTKGLLIYEYSKKIKKSTLQDGRKEEAISRERDKGIIYVWVCATGSHCTCSEAWNQNHFSPRWERSSWKSQQEKYRENYQKCSRNLFDGTQRDIRYSENRCLCASSYKDTVIDLEEVQRGFLAAHSGIKKYFEEMENTGDSETNEAIKRYLMKCTAIYKYREKLAESLKQLEFRMRVLSAAIKEDIDSRDPNKFDNHASDRQQYIDYYLMIHQRFSRKGAENAYDEIDKFINQTTDESIINKTTHEVQTGIRVLLGIRESTKA